MRTAVECRAVTAAYGPAPVLADLSMDVAEGERVALLGPNGAGKTTLLHVLTGFHRPAAGVVRLFGDDVRRLPPAERARRVAVVPQTLETPLAYTVADLVALGRTAAKPPWAGVTAGDRRAMERAMALTDVLDLRDRPYNELSGGERQRSAIAMALSREPALLLLDEPTAHLDINHRLDVLQLIERLNRERGLTVIMSSHDLNLAADFFPRLVLLDHGRIVASGTPSEVLEERRLAEVYHCALSVQVDPAGGTMVRPARTIPAAAAGAARTAHVIGGGGAGVEIMRRLSLAGWTVTCGALNEGDSDARAAAALGIEAALERPFSPLGEAALRRAAEMAAAADAVVVCEVPFGSGNVGNLDVAADACRRRRPVFLCLRGADGRDFTPDRSATAALRALVAAGATAWMHPGELLERMQTLPQ